jgi:hypothetical protein
MPFCHTDQGTVLLPTPTSPMGARVSCCPALGLSLSICKMDPRLTHTAQGLQCHQYKTVLSMVPGMALTLMDRHWLSCSTHHCLNTNLLYCLCVCVWWGE